MASCQNSPSTSLTPRQRAIYSYVCVRWSLLTECDSIQATNGTLDEEGQLRRYKFLLGSYATSPKTLFPIVIGHPTWETCWDSNFNGTTVMTVDQGYKAGLGVAKCLMKNYINIKGTVDFSKLVMAISSKDADSASAKLLKGLAETCAEYREYESISESGIITIADTYNIVTADEFINCWVTQGVLGIAKQEADKTASEFPEGCSFRLDNGKPQAYTS